MKFAVVREDPELEARLVERFGSGAVLGVASGGCTLLSLRAMFPALEVAGFDLNPVQVAHVRDKEHAVRSGEMTRLNVGSDEARGLNQLGSFEGVFRLLRSAVSEYVASADELAAYFDSDTSPADRTARTRAWFASPYWPAAFATVFNDPLLHAMFGPLATQHAVPGSYPGYFQRVFERGLTAEKGHRNYFLQHIFLGKYSLQDAPEYLRRPLTGKNAARPLELVTGSLPDVPELGRFDLFSLSNIFDWSDDAQISAWAQLLRARAKIGSVILVRQLNNERDIRRYFAPSYEFDDELGRELYTRDRSLFYERIEVGVRVRA